MKKSAEQIEQLIEKIEELIPFYRNSEEDKNISNGNTAVCIIDESGALFGKLFVNNNKIRARESFKVAWVKASQVWLTGLKTGEYEKKVYSGEINEGVAGISKPDLIGWEGGQPITLKSGLKLSVGFSGFRGVSDLEIVVKASEKIEA
jgi:glc operon protein GlcG